VFRRAFLVSVCRPSKQANNCDDFKHLRRSPANSVCISSISAWLAEWSERQVVARSGAVAWRYPHLRGLPLGQPQAQEMHAVNGNAHPGGLAALVVLLCSQSSRQILAAAAYRIVSRLVLDADERR
jgi:hypothetical protein